MNDENKVHLWMGTSHKSEEDYQAYFEIDYSTEGDFDSPDYKVCGFCKDIGEVWYDEDFIGIIDRTKKPVPVADWLTELAIDASEHEKVLAICVEKGIAKANAVFWYQDASLTLPEPHKNDYNELHYIGVFEGD